MSGHYGTRYQRLRASLWGMQRGHCHYCGCYVKKADATLDHRVPKSLGGPATFENSVMACEPCNRSKADLLEPAFLAKISTGSKRRKRVNLSDKSIRQAAEQRKMELRRSLGRPA